MAPISFSDILSGIIDGTPTSDGKQSDLYTSISSFYPAKVLEKAYSTYHSALATGETYVEISQSLINLVGPAKLYSTCSQKVCNSILWKCFMGPSPADGHSKDEAISCTDLLSNYQTPKYPIILCHGFSGFDRLVYIPALSAIIDASLKKTKEEKREKKTEVLEKEMINKDKQEIHVQPDNADDFANGISLFEYWHGIKEALESNGCGVLVAKVPPFGTIETRANALNEFITEKAAKWQEEHHSKERIKVNLVAHSMGGLDCRYLISELEKRNYEVISLTTISTLHRGTYAADFAVDYAPEAVIDKHFPSVRQLTRAYSKEFNEKILDSPSVKYFSFGAAADPKMSNLYYLTWSLINQEEGPNDGMVSLKSCKWGKYLGYLENVDHKQLINWMGGISRVRQTLGWKNEGFNPIAFYLGIADNLAKNGL